MEDLLGADGTPGELLQGKHKVVRFFLVVWTKPSLWIEDASLTKDGVHLCFHWRGFGGVAFFNFIFL